MLSETSAAEVAAPTPNGVTMLILESDAVVREALRKVGSDAGCKTVTANEASEALRVIDRGEVDLILVGIGLRPGGSTSAVGALRAACDLPIVVIGPARDTIETVVALEIGADDYISREAEPREIIARLLAKVRRYSYRSEPSTKSKVVRRYYDLTVNPGRHEVLRGGAPVALTPTEFDLIHLLISRQEMVVSRDDIIAAIWGDECPIDKRSVDAHIYRLRNKLRDAEGGVPGEAQIKAIPGVGYKLDRRMVEQGPPGGVERRKPRDSPQPLEA